MAIDAETSPLLWFTSYYAAPEKVPERLTDDRRWYLTADHGRIDDDGHFHFTACNDDVILAAGYRIGLSDVESVRITRPPSRMRRRLLAGTFEGSRTEVVEAFLLTEDDEANDDVAGELQQLVRDEYSKHAHPRSMHFIDAPPKAQGGKVQRHLLRER